MNASFLCVFSNLGKGRVEAESHLIVQPGPGLQCLLPEPSKQRVMGMTCRA